jgi:hypothetical protein
MSAPMTDPAPRETDPARPATLPVVEDTKPTDATKQSALGNQLITVVLTSVGLAWFGFLAYLCVYTSNPVLLNYKQLWQAHSLWVAEVIDAEAGKVKILKDFKNHPFTPEAVVHKVPPGKLKTGETYLLPVALVYAQTDGQGELQIVPVMVKKQEQYPIYRWTPELGADVQQHLNVILSPRDPYALEDVKPESDKPADTPSVKE